MKPYIIKLRIGGNIEYINCEGKDKESAYKEAMMSLFENIESKYLFIHTFELSNGNKITKWHLTQSRARKYLVKNIQLLEMYRDTRIIALLDFWEA